MNPNAPTNRLRDEASPYLRQHAANPVDWYPWGPEALARAKTEGKPILLSVGYSACHWCHVMAHECFENPHIAKMMNEGFINIKVDREERPDIDEIYQRVTQLVTGNGGWPLTVFLMPDLRPIYGGTYFPPDDKYGRPGFPRVMAAVIDAMRNKPENTEKGAAEIVERMQMFDEVQSGTAIPDRETLGLAESLLAKNFDAANGGFGSAPKFPMVSDHQALLARYRATGKPETLQMVLFTLRKMADGGIYDQLGGGFHRYSTDAHWLAPHFEKMLYDNALIPLLYLEAFRLTGDVSYTHVVHETIGYLLREMHSPDGGFYSSQDADSEGVEGKFFVWSLAEIQSILGIDRAATFADVYDVTARGNWEHATILRVVKPPAEVAAARGIDPAAFEWQLAEDRAKLLAAREKRIKPGLDNKQIAAWNGLTLSLFAQAGALLQRPDYLAVARKTATFLLEKMAPGGDLKRIYGEAKINGFLDDYAYTAAGLLDLHRATGEARWAQAARHWVDRILAAFVDSQGVLYLTPTGAESLPSRPKSGYDQMLPSPAAIAIQAIWRIYVLTGESRYREAAEKILLAYGNEIIRQPTAYAGMLSSLDLYHRGETTCVIVGPLSRAETGELADAARRMLPLDEAVLVKEQSDGIGKHLTEGKNGPDGGSAAFLCQGYACMPAARSPAELRARLGNSVE